MRGFARCSQTSQRLSGPLGDVCLSKRFIDLPVSGVFLLFHSRSPVALEFKRDYGKCFGLVSKSSNLINSTLSVVVQFKITTSILTPTTVFIFFFQPLPDETSVGK